MSVSDSEGRQQLSMVEKIVGGAILGLLAWVGLTVQQMSVDVAVLKTQVQLSNGDRFTAMEGKAFDARLVKVENRLDALEGKDKR